MASLLFYKICKSRNTLAPTMGKIVVVKKIKTQQMRIYYYLRTRTGNMVTQPSGNELKLVSETVTVEEQLFFQKISFQDHDPALMVPGEDGPKFLKNSLSEPIRFTDVICIES